MKGLFEYDYSLPAGDKVYLKDIITDVTYERMFKGKNISVLNKGICGNGGTTGFIDYGLEHSKGCLILVPNRSIVLSKEEEYKDNPEVCCVYGGSGGFDKDTRIVIATYDQFPRLLDCLSQFGFTQRGDLWSNEFWVGRTIIIDEYHKLVDESGLRSICHKMTDMVKNTDSSVVLMSATPHWGYISLIRDLVKDRDVITYNIDYKHDDYVKLIQVYNTKKRDLISILKKVKDSPKNGHTCVFYNSVNGISEIIDHIGGDDCEVLCSEKNEKDLGNYYSKTFDEKKKLHFMTSAYFTGHDIHTHVEQCIIIGSGETENMCLGVRDIKQMIGRFREGVSGIHLFYLNRKTNRDKYQTVKTKYDTNVEYLQMMGDNWKTKVKGVELKQDTIRLEDTLERFDYWSRKDRVSKRLEEYGYVVKQKEVGDFESVGKRRKLTFNETKQRIGRGTMVSYDENKYSVQIQEYMKEKGVEEMLRSPRTTILDWYKIRKNIGISDLDMMSPEEKFKVMGLENFGRYRGSYLMSCLKYLGVTCEYFQLPSIMRESFGCFVTLWKGDPKGCESGNTYIVFMKMKTNVGLGNNGVSSYLEGLEHTPQSRDMSYKLSYQTGIKGKNCYGKTILMKNAPSVYGSLKGIHLYDWVNEDKEHRLPEVKGDKCWKNIKNYDQTKISEMYKETDNEYRHSKSSMEYIDCLIVDIDSGITFQEFRERYGDYLWVSYPTINNIPDDWNKFRVIVPLRNRLRLSGEYSVMTLKMLRSMFCYYEDPNHQVSSYVNLEDWLKMRGNNGELYDIPQEVVDNIMLCIKNSKDMGMMSFNKDQTDKSVQDHKGTKKTLEWSQDYFKSSFELGDGERHKRLFVIKNSLDEPDRDRFQSWLNNTYPSYLTHWKSHRVIRRT